jgi:hypothetical protein
MEAAKPIKSQEEIEKNEREEEIRKKEKFLLEKHLEGRKFDEEKIKKWSNSILEEMDEFLSTKYPSFGFGLFLFVSEPISYSANRQSVYIPKTDSSLTEVYKSNNIKASFRVFITKLKNEKFDVEKVNLDHLLKVNKIFNDSFEGRSFSDNKIDFYLENAINDINTYLLKFDELGHSFHQGFVFNNNENKFHFYYKFGKMRFFPYCASFSNESLLAHLFLFFVSN